MSRYDKLNEIINDAVKKIKMAYDNGYDNGYDDGFKNGKKENSDIS